MADPANDFDHLGIREVLETDSRPTFILDLDPDEEISPRDGRHLQPAFCNAALRQHERLYDMVIGKGSSSHTATIEQHNPPDFRAWATSITKHDDSKDIFPLFFEYAGLLWTGSTVRRRWRLISGNRMWKDKAPSLNLSSGVPIEVSNGGSTTGLSRLPAADGDSSKRASARGTGDNALPTRVPLASSKQAERLTFSRESKTSAVSSSERSSFMGNYSIPLGRSDQFVTDWTVLEPKGVLSEHILFARSIDWGATPLGPMRSWTRELRQVVNLIMGNPHPAALFWGSDFTMIYNEAYVRDCAGNKHPALMGTGFSGPFSEVSGALLPMFIECARTGVSIRRENDYLPIERYGLLEETFFSWSFTPLYGGTDRILGFYNAPFEITQMERHKRQMQTINRIGECTSRAKSVKQFWKRVLEGLEENIWDVPFALLYSVGESDDVDQSSVSSGNTMLLKTCHLEGALGVPEDHAAAPKQLDLKRSLEGFIPSFREAMRTREPTLLQTRDGTLPEALLEGIEYRGYSDIPCKEAVIYPVRPTNGERVLAFLLVGVNSMRPYDASYKSFVNLLNRSLATSLASIILFEEEVRKSRDAAEAAALEQEKLSEQLALQTDRFRRMTEVSPLGMFLVTPEGVLREANDRFFQMTGLLRDNPEALSWMDFLEESSRGAMNEGWRLLVDEHIPWSGEVQLQKTAEWAKKTFDTTGETMDSWVLFTAQPEFASDGSLRSIMGSITDISHLKWAQGLQNMRLQEAEETRRQQNEFIDITSHEMRNPLSAILQCADVISSALEDPVTKQTPPSKDSLDSCIDAARTISLCVQHQKNIVDDILTISKLDSKLLVITPTPSQPIQILRQAVKMVESELRAKQIELLFDEHPSYEELEIDWAMLDPSRVLQVLINLLTNAIKFTAGCEKRTISVAVAASESPPSAPGRAHAAARWLPDFRYVPASKRKNDNATEGEDWGDGETVFIRFKVQDTGVGLTNAEKQILFAKFQQASPRTHAQYGGSGLGLFICKQLCELHGGSIGVASEANVGSLFGFYVRARRCASPRKSDVASPKRRSEQLVTLKLPLAPIQEDVAGPPPGSKVTPAKASSAFDPSTLHVLVVEDNLINQKVLVKQLRNFSCTVGVANDGIEALEFLATTIYMTPQGEPLDIILMDLEMPRLNGLDCVERIRKLEADGLISRGRVPVIAVTANVRPEQVATAKERGCDDVLPKPFRIPDLFKKMEALLKRDLALDGSRSGI